MLAPTLAITSVTVTPTIEILLFFASISDFINAVTFVLEVSTPDFMFVVPVLFTVNELLLIPAA